jgi:hypothetical protein
MCLPPGSGIGNSAGLNQGEKIILDGRFKISDLKLLILNFVFKSAICNLKSPINSKYGT